MMENNFTFKNAVTLVRYRPETTSFAQTLGLFQGLQGGPAIPKFPTNQQDLTRRDSSRPQFGPKNFIERGK
jgi:hypothetical protein